MCSLDLTQSPYIRDIQKGLLEEGHFLAKKIHLNMGKKNRPFLRMLLADKTGHLPAVYFGPLADLQKIKSQIGEGDIVKISGILEEFQAVLQIKILRIEKDQKENWELSRFWRRTPHDRRLLYRALKKYLEKIRDQELKNLCFSFLKDRSFMKLFLEAPASRFAHHAYIGGLLEHTLHVVELVDAYARIYEQADRDLLIAGAFLHDLGKTDEYQYLFTIDQSVAGKLKGHTLLSYDRVRPRLLASSLSEALVIKLEHIILSHQGRRNWGAIEEPRFLEAYLVHAADSTDASQFIYSNAKREALNNAVDPQNAYWSDYVSYLGRKVYLG